MKINLSKSKQEILHNIQLFIKDVLFEKFPLLINNSTILVVGSLSTDTYDTDSDIDLQIIRSETIESTELAELKKYKEDLINSGSNIELRFSRTYEVMEKYLNWNDDYVLGELQSALVLRDSNDRFSSLIKKFEWYPSDVYKDKIKWLLSEIILITKKEFLTASGRGHQYYTEVLKTKYLRYLLTLIRLLHKKYPIYDKKILETTLPLIKDETVKTSIKNIIMEKDNMKTLECMSSLNKSVLTLVQNDINESLYEKELLKFSTKNKILFE